MNTLQTPTVRRTLSESTLGMDSLAEAKKKDLREGDLHKKGPSSTTPKDDRPPSPNNNPPRVPPRDNNSMDTTFTMAPYSQIYADETYLEGEMLLENFVDDQISKSGILTPGCETPRTLNKRTHSANINSAGRELRRMADAFELTYERQQVKVKANEIGLGVQTYAEFRELLSALFNPGGITQSRIIVLFFFCSDVAIRSLKSGIDLFKRFMKWSFQYFAERVCDWVKRNGGWVAVLSPQHFYPRVVVAAAALVVVCAVVYKFVKK